MLTQARARELIAASADQRVLVVGDLMLDQFVTGRVDRISPEAPVPVVKFERNEFRAGGAANVAHNLRALGARVDVIGIIGHDADGTQLMSELRRCGIETGRIAIGHDRSTTKKVRIVTTRHQQVARIDYESDAEAAGDLEARLLSAIDEAAALARAIVVSDYLKGAITRPVMDCVVRSGRSFRVPVLVDPKIPHLTYYAGATLITPNHHEAETATHMRVRSDNEVHAAAVAFREQSRCGSVLITRGEHGMCLLDGASPDSAPRVHHLPAAAREVADVTGAGDTVIATLALALAVGARSVEAAELANRAAGIVVGKFGPATVTPDELLRSLPE